MDSSNLYLQYEYVIAATQLVFAMLGMGATLKVEDFLEVLLEPKAVIVGVCMMVLVGPAIALSCIHLFPLTYELVIGIALVSAIPGGTASNIFTYFSNGNISLSIAVTAITTVACLIATPLILGFLIGDYLPSDFQMPTSKIVVEITIFLLIPLVAGMAVLRWLPEIAKPVHRWGIRGAVLGMVVIVVGSINAGRINLDDFGYSDLIMFSAFFMILVLSSVVLTRVLGLLARDSVAINMEVTVRNVNLGVLIIASVFPAHQQVGSSIGEGAMLYLLLYGALQLLAAFPLIVLNRRRVASLL